MEAGGCDEAHRGERRCQERNVVEVSLAGRDGGESGTERLGAPISAAGRVRVCGGAARCFWLVGGRAGRGRAPGRAGDSRCGASSWPSLVNGNTAVTFLYFDQSLSLYHQNDRANAYA